MATQIKEGNEGLPATPKQTWAIFKLGGGDVRDNGLTRQKASDMISKLMAEKGIEPGKKTAKNPKEDRDANFQSIYDKAWAAGVAAATATVPPTMIVAQHVDPLDDNSPITQAWSVPEGPCGFAWVNLKPGTSAFAKWLKAKGYARTDSYYGGVTIRIGDYNQSVTRKEAHAYAMADVLREAGFKAYASSRLD